MDANRNLRFLKILLEDEPLTRKNQPLKYGINTKTAKRIFDFFSIKILNKPEISAHFTKNSSFFRLKTIYLFNNQINTYSLTTETNQIPTKKSLKEFFYLKLILHILFKGDNKIFLKSYIENN